MADERFDVIVVGLGAAGAVVTESLSGAGWKVLALEEGPWYHPFKDFASGNAPRVPSGVLHDEGSVSLSLVKAVGGGTVFYAGVFFRFHESDFRTRTRYGCGTDWPLTYRELEPFYDKVEEFTGASGSNKNVFEVPRGPYPNPPHPISRGSQYFASGARALGLHPAVTPMSILSRPYRGRPACTYCAQCGAGCMVGDKSSVEMTYVPAAVKNGADIRPDHRVLTIETDTTGKVTGVVYRNSQGTWRAQSDLVVLCGGAVLNPGLLLRSATRVHNQGLGNHSGQVGRNLFAHTGGRYMARMPEPVNGFMGISGGVNVQDFYEGDPKAEFHRGYTLYMSLTPGPPDRFADWYLDEWGDDLVKVMESYNRIVRIAVLGEDQAGEGNHVSPDPDAKDEDGFPLTRVSYQAGSNEKALFSHAVESARRICQAAGADDWELFYPDNSSAHPLGTCRMGDDPDTSVVNRWGACHTVPGLYICDGSVFPTSAAVNPACTIMALAARTADHLRRRTQESNLK